MNQLPNPAAGKPAPKWEEVIKPPTPEETSALPGQMAPIMKASLSDLVREADITGEDLEAKLDMGVQSIRVSLKHPAKGRRKRLSIEMEG